MNRTDNLFRDLLILMVLISIGIFSRFAIDLPNFKPIAAIVLFTAFWFRSYWVAGLSLLLVMLVSNTGLDHCPWQVTLGVVGGLAVAALLGRRLRSQFQKASEVSKRPANAIVQLFGSAFAMSAAFFLISNFAVWSMGQWYPMTSVGLVNCFAAAVPFFKYTLGGDLLFTTAIFATWYVVEIRTSLTPAPVSAHQ